MLLYVDSSKYIDEKVTAARKYDNIGKEDKVGMLQNTSIHILPYFSDFQSIFYILTQTLYYRHDMTQGQYLSGIKLAWIQRFPSRRLVA